MLRQAKQLFSILFAMTLESTLLLLANFLICFLFFSLPSSKPDKLFLGIPKKKPKNTFSPARAKQRPSRSSLHLSSSS